MAITGYSQVYHAGVTTVTATSDTTGVVFFHWYVDGVWAGVTTSPSWSLVLTDGDQARVEAIDTTDENYDHTANAPTMYAARRTLYWQRSTDTDVDYYQVEQSVAGAAWAAIATVYQVPGRWDFELVTDRLTDLTSYAWRVLPVDKNGNAGSPLAGAAEKIVRTPDAPDFAIAFDGGTTKITISGAA